MDMFGSVWGTLAVNFIIIIGSLLTCIAAKVESFGLMVAGRVLFGIGSGLIVTMQESMLSKWFRTQNLSIAIGLQLSISRLATFLGTLVANPIAQRTGDWVWSFWLSFIICCFSILMNLVYALVVRHLRRQSGDKDSAGALTKLEIQQQKKRKAFHFKSLVKFPIYYWHILLIEFIFAAVWSSFQTISTEFVQIHFGDSDAVLAGYQASASQSVPIVATPLLGIFMDFFGGRITICKYIYFYFLKKMKETNQHTNVISTCFCRIFDSQYCFPWLDLHQRCSRNGLLLHLTCLWTHRYDHLYWYDCTFRLYWYRSWSLQEFKQCWYHHS
jgi:MFS family permease